MTDPKHKQSRLFLLKWCVAAIILLDLKRLCCEALNRSWIIKVLTKECTSVLHALSFAFRRFWGPTCVFLGSSKCMRVRENLSPRLAPPAPVSAATRIEHCVSSWEIGFGKWSHIKVPTDLINTPSLSPNKRKTLSAHSYLEIISQQLCDGGWIASWSVGRN